MPRTHPARICNYLAIVHVKTKFDNTKDKQHEWHQNDREFDRVRDTFKRLSEQTRLSLDGSLGNLTAGQIKELKAAGMRRFNHNLQCSREFYPEIVSTHTYDERMETLTFLKEQGVEICSGGIFGMGETAEDRIKLAFELTDNRVAKGAS